MEGLYALLSILLVSVVSAHFEGYPFKHTNEGRYGAAYKVANYGNRAVPAAPVKAKAPAVTYGTGGAGFGTGNEFNYRGFGGFPVHVGNGKFYYLGHFRGTCVKGQGHGFYFAGDSTSFVVCDNGRSHRFRCPKGTANKDSSKFELNHSYRLEDMCSVNTLH